MIKQFVISQGFITEANALLNDQTTDQKIKDQINAIFNVNPKTVLRIQTEELYQEFKLALTDGNVNCNVLKDAVMITLGIFFQSMPDPIALGFSLIATNTVVNQDDTNALPITYINECSSTDSVHRIHWINQLIEAINATKIEYSILDFIDSKIVKTKHTIDFLSTPTTYTHNQISEAINFYLSNKVDLNEAIHHTFKFKLNPLIKESYFTISAQIIEALSKKVALAQQNTLIVKKQHECFMLLEGI